MTASDQGWGSGAEVLWAAAVGAEPGRHPLPPAVDAESRWWRAVALGGQGRYANAAAELQRLLTPAVAPWLRSLATSTRASHLRQVGDHGRASRLDGAALTMAAGLAGRNGATARCDALIGLAADALGSGRITLARTLLGRAAAELASAEQRCAVRWHWVSAEAALFARDTAVARVHAGTARRLAEELISVRHQVKSLLVEAAATGSVPAAEQAKAAAQSHNLVPLHWAASMLLRAQHDGPAGDAFDRAGALSRATLTRWGAAFPDIQ